MTCAIKELKKGDIIDKSFNVGKYQPIYYAGASGDYNLIHIDPEFGKMVGLGGNILQGLCTMAFAATTLTDFVSDPSCLKRIKVRFKKPVKPDDEVNVKATVVDCAEGMVRTEIVAVNQKGDEVIGNAWAEMTYKKCR